MGGRKLGKLGTLQMHSRSYFFVKHTRSVGCSQPCIFPEPPFFLDEQSRPFVVRFLVAELMNIEA